MIVEQILRSKGTEVYAVAESSPIADAVAVLDDRNIGAVVVRGTDGRVVGILSERDIVRRLRKDGAGVMSAHVGAYMTAEPITCRLDDSVEDLMSLMTERRIRHVPVIDGESLVGLISIGDVVKRKIEQAESEAAMLKEYIAS